MNLRIGQGFDFHPLVTGRPLILGGIELESDKGLAGHSDADALLHAVCDALLGAAGLPDIGSLFPDDDPRYENAASSSLLIEVVRRVEEAGYRVGNVDLTVIAEAPRIKPYVPALRASLSRMLQVSEGDVGIKATTMEGKGPIGRGEGIAVQAVVLLYRLEVDEP